MKILLKYCILPDSFRCHAVFRQIQHLDVLLVILKIRRVERKTAVKHGFIFGKKVTPLSAAVSFMAVMGYSPS